MAEIRVFQIKMEINRFKVITYASQVESIAPLAASLLFSALQLQTTTIV